MRLHRIILILPICFLLPWKACHAGQQQDSTSKNKLFDKYYPKLQYEFGALNNLSIGLGFPKVYTDIILWQANGPFFDCGIGFWNEELLLTNKLGYEYYYLVLAARFNLINHTNFSKNQIALRPEIGLTLFTKLTIMYGYNLTDHGDHFGLNGHILSINIGYL